MTTRHNLTKATDVLQGDVYFEPYYATYKRSGLICHFPILVEYGAILAADDDHIVANATSTELPDTATITYTPATDGTTPLDASGRASVVSIKINGQTESAWEFATPRNISVHTTHGSSIVASTVTVTGYDEYERAMSETITVAATGTNETDVGLKAFKWVTSVAITSAADSTTNTMDVGTGTVIGLPYRIDDKYRIVAFSNSVVDASATIVVADATAATATTGDIRGTVAFSDAPDASKKYAVWVMPEARSGTKVSIFGIAQNLE